MVMHRTCACGESYTPRNISEGACSRCRKLQTLRLQPLSLGRLVATPAALALIEREGYDPWRFIRRHQQHDWGDLDPHDVRVNEDALLMGARIMSVYPVTETDKVWVITEWDRSVTTLLLPNDY